MSAQTSAVHKRLHDDFGFFLFMIWKHLQLPAPTPLQKDIADYLATGPTRCIIEAFRGCGKSFITSAYVVWLLYRNPMIKVLVVSATKERADAFSSFTKRLIQEVDFLQHLAPRAGQRDSLIAFDVGPALTDHSPSVKSASITGQITGSRADVIIADDVEIPGNSYTQDARDKLATLVTEFDAILKPYDPRTMSAEPRIVYLGTPQCEMSLYNGLREKGYEARIWPLLYPDEKTVTHYKGALAPSIAEAIESRHGVIGESTEPIRFGMEDIEKRRLSYGKAGFSLQFMLDTALADGERYPLKLSDLVVMDIPPRKAPVEYTVMRNADTELPLESVGLPGDRYFRPYFVSKETQPYTGAVMAIDPSGRGTDETTWAIVKMYAGNLFVPKIGGSREGYTEQTLRNLAYTAKRHNVNRIIIEANFGDGMFTQLLKPVLTSIYPCTTEEVKHSKQKERRIIDTLEPVMMQHRLVVDPVVIKDDLATCEQDLAYSCFHQMSRLTADRGSLRHDDRLDVLAMAVAYWVDRMGADAGSVERQRQEEELEKFLASYVLGATPSRETWFDDALR